MYKRQLSIRETRIQLPKVAGIKHPPIGSTNIEDNLRGSFFEPQRSLNDNTPTGIKYQKENQTPVEAPEKKLTLFAFRIAIVEKIASRIGQLGFVWATVVLLGGLGASTKDFWFVTAIILTEGTRLFGRSYELEWQHQATWSLASSGWHSFRDAIVLIPHNLLCSIKAIFKPISSVGSKGRQIANEIRNTQDPLRRGLDFQAKRTWLSSDVPFFSFHGWFFLSKNISLVLHWLQVVSAIVCMTLSSMRLIQNDYGDSKNALIMFYDLALIEALMFLLENLYWQWAVTVRKLLKKVNQDCDLGPSGMVAVRRFLYDAYSSCVNGSIFDGLKMDFVSFAGELLNSDFHNEQLMGSWILSKFVTNQRFSNETLRKIGSSTAMMERLLEMLNWKNPEEEEIRRSAAEIISKLAGRKQNALRVASIPGAMECVSSLLNTGRSSDGKPYEINEKRVLAGEDRYDFSIFNLQGLRILKKLARDHENCYKIGNSRGLLAKIIDFTYAGESMLRNEQVTESQIKLVKRSLQVVRMLVRATGHTGQMLRQEISDIVFTVSNIREILEFGEMQMMLQKLGIEVLTSLAMDEVAREKIGRTGKVIKQLLRIFCTPGSTEDQNSLRVEAGEALAMLALENESNCSKILKEKDAVKQLTDTLRESYPRVNACRILRNLCAYSGNESFHRLKGVTAAMPTVLDSIMRKKNKLLEVSIGLAAQLFKFTNKEGHEDDLQKAGITDDVLAEKLVDTLKEYKFPDIKVPRMRRYIIQAAIWMMKSNPNYVLLFKELNMEDVIRDVEETTSELEYFQVFSGSVGLSRHKLSMPFLVDSALELLAQDLN